MAKSVQVLKTEIVRKLDSIPVGNLSEAYRQKAQLFKQLQKHDPQVDMMCRFYADKANKLLKEPLRPGEDTDFSFMYLFAEPPGYFTDVVDGIEGYLRTGKLPREVVEAEKNGGQASPLSGAKSPEMQKEGRRRG
jgi:hypothetical protein